MSTTRESQKETNRTESPVIKQIRLRATERGGRLFRNTVGVFYSKAGAPTSVGLCPGSHDLIGFMPLEVCGITLPIFTSIEVKAGRTKTSKEQLNFRKMVLTMNGVSAIVRSVNEFDTAVTHILSEIKKRIVSAR